MEGIELRSTKEEADTRVLLHALHAAKAGSKAVIVTAEDTYVMMLCLGFNRYIPCSIYQKKQMHMVHRLWEIGKFICDALIGLHAFTSSDTVSALTGRGKLGAMKLMKHDCTYQEIFSQLGQSLNNCMTKYSCLPVTCMRQLPALMT